MKATLGELWNSRSVLERLAEQRFPAKVSYKLMKTIDHINKELQPFAKARLGIFEKYGEKVGETINIKEENKDIFKAELDELENTEVELKFDLTIDELAPAQITPSEMFMIDYMFKE